MSKGSLAGTFEDDDILFADLDDFDGDSALDVTCPGCGARLNSEPLFSKFRICPSCSRHFWMPARERLELLIDSGSFRETNAELVSVDPLMFRDAVPLPDRVSHARDESSYPISEALITGTAKIGGRDAIVVVIDFALLGDAIGVVAGEKLVLAIELAASRRLPLIATCAGGAHRANTSMLSLVQSMRIANALAKLQRNGVAFVSLMSHPTAGAVFSGFAGHANLLFAEPGSHIGMTVHRSLDAEQESQSGTQPAESLLERGIIDGIVDRRNARDHLVTVLDILTARTAPRIAASAEASPVALLSAAQEIVTARHPGRPGAMDYVERLMPGFVELHGDRSGSDDPGITIGLGQLDGVSLGVVCVNRESRSGARHPEQSNAAAGYRKACRLYRLAALLELPVVTLVDGLEPGISDGMSGAEVGMMLSQLKRTLSSLPVPVVAVIIGEVNGSHATAFSIADRTLMLEHAVFSTSESEHARASPTVPRAASAPVVLTSRDCRRFGLVDAVIPEPGTAAHGDPSGAAQQLRLGIIRSLGELSVLGPRRLQDERSRKYRYLGLAGSAGTEAVRYEIAQLQELQRTVGRSLDDLRDRIEHHHLTLPSRPHLPQRPAILSVPLPERPNLPSIRRPVVNRAEIADFAGRLATSGRVFAERVNDARRELTGEEPGAPPDETPAEQRDR
jgi:acyl-CoA carboxylase subunit beta